MLTPFESAIVAHLIADWLLQNDWMAIHKRNLRHPAGWVHAGIHGLLLGCVLGWRGGVVLGIVHLLIDTGRPVDWWMRVFKKCQHAPLAPIIALFVDQALHVATIATWVAWGPAQH